MGSSEIVDSGWLTGQKSNFSQTCSLLSQYLKEKGSFGDLSLGLTRNYESNGAPAKTMNLLPMIEKTGPNQEAPARDMLAKNPNKPVKLFQQQAAFPSNPAMEEAQKVADISATKPGPETAQMTIFYAGQVIVFNDFPADKVKEIMLLASKGSPQNANTFTTNMVQKRSESAISSVTPTPSIVPSFGNNLVQDHSAQTQRPIPANVNDLPIARKASLTRFLEKRKDRITARAPYQTSHHNPVVAPSKSAESKTWLGLAAQFPLQMERQL